MLLIKLNIIYANKAIICFKNRISLSYLNTIRVSTLVDMANFYIIDIFTLFLFYLKNMDILGVYLKNITNQLICQKNKSIPILCKLGHP